MKAIFQYPVHLSILLLLTMGLAPRAAWSQCDTVDFDMMCLEGILVSDAVVGCGFDCVFSGDLASCFAACIGSTIPTMTGGCIDCFTAQSSCAQDNCFLTCAFGSTADCEACIMANCQTDFENCAGIVDVDGDGESTICDCDDSDASVYTGAPGTFSGLDNNCDGIISLEEIFCALDLTGDFLVSVADMLVMLGDFGCLIGCDSDLNGDGAVTVSDVLEMLGGFGEGC